MSAPTDPQATDATRPREGAELGQGGALGATDDPQGGSIQPHGSRGA